jgi:predicted PurR-regulated permease PerM
MIRPLRSSGSSNVQTAAILIGVVAVLYLAREILVPLAFAIVLTFVLAPAVAGLRKLRIGRVPAVLLVMVVTVAVAAGISFVILNQLIQVVNDLPSYRENIDRKIQVLHTPNKGAFERAAQSVKEIGKEIASAQEPVAPPTPKERAARPNSQNQPARPLPVQIVEAPATGLEYALGLTKPFLAPLGVFGIVLVFSVFLLIEEADLRNRLFRLAGLDRLNVMTQALDDATRRVSRYLMLQFLVNAGFGVLCGIGLYLIGVPYAVLWGTVAALLRIVPYVGSVAAGLLPLLLSLAVFDGWMPPLLVFLLFSTLELVTGNLLEPWLYGVHTGISSLALLLTTVFWTALWGPAGLILSTPLTVCVVVLGRHVPHLSFLHILLGDQPVLAADAQIYQRLLAMDNHEALAVADRYLAENSLVQLYDSVIIPALTMAEQDRHKGALEPDREEFLFLSVREMLAEFSEKTMTSALEPSKEPPPAASSRRVLCIPANDEADEIAAVMLAQLLEQRGCVTIAFPLDSSLQDMIALAEPAGNDVLCVSAVPPFAFAHARTLSRQLRVRFPRTTIVAGVWGFTGDTERALQRFEPGRPDKLVTTFAGAIQFLAAADSPNVETPLQLHLVTMTTGCHAAGLGTAARK